MREYDVVLLKKTLTGTAVPVSCERTIVMLHDEVSQACEVEFFDQNNKTIDVCTVVGDEYLELKLTCRNTK